ncbi:MAG: hypothetical protein ACOWYE_15380 [Desulfatiglandales bacterium]
MPSCHDMKKGEIYTCKDCGIELQVIKECRDVGKPAEDCGCHPSAAPCTFSCCGEELVKKE